MKSAVRFALLALPLTVAACRDNGIDDSADVSTRDMQVVVAVNGEADGTVVRAHPSALLPYSGRLTLTGGDRLVLRGEGELRPDGAEYALKSPRKSGSFVLDLLRAHDHPLTDLEVVVPPPFTLTARALRVRWSEPIELTWEAAPGEHVTSIEWTGACTKRVVRPLAADAGAYVVNGGEVFRVDPSAPCPVTFSITRTAPGRSMRTLYATAKQTRTVEIVLDP